jgi:hypoxanthine phosphoribosyltransferase
MVSTAPIQIADLSFVPFIDHSQILERVKELGNQITQDYHNKKPVFIPILNGSFMFAADLMKEVDLPCEVSFVKVASYHGARSTGDVKEILGLQTDVKGRHVVIVEDIVDTGITMSKLLKTLWEKEPASVQVAALFIKPESLQVEIDIAYKGFEIANKFIVGYGLDYNGEGRNFPDVYQLAD